MNYRRIYFSIIERRKQTPPIGYSEVHHITPKSLGGSNDHCNLVRLTAKEHYLCHLLLIKMVERNSFEYYKMVKAFSMMANCSSANQKRIITSRMYERLKEDFSIAQSISQAGKGNFMFGKVRSPETKEKISQSIRKTLLKKFGPKYGKVSKAKRERKKRVGSQREMMRQKYKDWYEMYDKVGFVKFCELTGYQQSIQNLVQRFKRWVPEFIPQPRKRRGSLSEY